MRKKLTYFYSLLLTALFLLPWSGIKADETLALYGTATSTTYYVPAYGGYFDVNQHNQFVFPADDLEDMKGCIIKGMKFHLKTLGSWSSAGSAQPTVVVSLAEIEGTTLSALNTTASFQEVYSGSYEFNTTNKEWVVTFPSDKYYTYGDKNLLVDIVSTAGGKYITTTWYVTSATGAAYTYGAQRSYLPRTTFTYDEAPASSCPKPTDITPASIDATSASFTWSKGGDESSWQYICLPAGTAVDWSDAAVETAITTAANVSGLDPNTAYKFYVRAYCGGGEGEQSSEVSLAFTTDKSCYEPASVVVSEITANSATATWTESGHGETQWQYAIVEGSAAPSSWSSATTSKSYTFTGLTPNTSYKVWVRSYCGAEDESEAISSAAFTTPCAAQTGVGTENFEGVTAGSGNLPGCWNAITYERNYYGDIYVYPYVASSSYSAHGGSKYLTFYGGVTGTSEQIAILPSFTEDLNTLTISFYYNNSYTNASYGQFTLGYYKNGTFTPIEALERKDAYTLYEKALSGIPSGSRLAIKYTGASSSTTAYIDDLEIKLTPSCVKPTGASGSATAYNQASISWTANGSESAWKLQYSSDNGSNWTDANSGNSITANPYTLTGLSGSTSYIVRVKADCGGDEYSDWSANSAAFKTPCEAIASLSNFSFETSEGCTTGSMPDCWTKLPSANTYPQVYNYYGKSSTYSLRFYGNTTQYAILPEFTQEVKNLTISFYYYSGVLEVGSMTDPTDASTFKSLATAPAISSYGDAATKVDLSSADDGAYFIAFKHSGTNTYDGNYVDLVSVYVTPTCLEPTSVSASSITSNSASISWTNGGSETAWKLQYSTDGSNWTDANGGADITTNPYTLSGLASATTYYARVKAVCGGSDASDWSDASAAFTTSCAAISSLPWTENFNNKTVDQIPLCWSAAGNTSAVSVKSSSSYLTLNSKALYFTGGSGSDVYVLLPNFEADLSTLQIEFSHVEENNTKSGKIEVGYHDGTSFTSLRACDYSTSSSAWRTESAVTFPSAANGANIAFHYKPINSGYTAAIDDITVSVAPSCAVPSGFGTSVIGVNSATVFWAADAASAWKLQYKAEGDADWSAEQSVATTPSFDLSGLAASTRYYVRVKADCGGGDVSEYSDGTFSFITDCAAKTVTELAPWEYGFEDADANAMPACWERIEAYSGHGYPRVLNDSYNANAGSKYLYFYCPGRNTGLDAYTETAILPTFNEEIKKLQISFNYKNSSTGTKYGQLAVGYVVGNAFTQVQLLDKKDSYTSTGAIEMPNEAPNGARIAIRCIGGNQGSSYTTYGYVDGISVSFKPSCYVPTGLTAVATSDGANVSWTAGAEETAWNLRYSVKDADSWTTVSSLSATNHTISGLSTDNTYEVQVQADCGGLQSAWTASAEFTPVCNAPTALAVTARTQTSATFSWASSESAWKLQYKAEGDADWSEVNVATNPFTLTGLTAGTNYQAKIQSACGSAFTDAVSFTTWCNVKDASELPIDITSFSAVPECWEATFKGEYSQVAGDQIVFYGTEEQWLVLPAYDINLNQLSVTFTFTINGPDPEFGYLDEPNGTFHAFSSALTSGNELNLENEVAAVKYIAIRYPGGSSEFAYLRISAVNVRRTPGCSKLDAPTATPGVGSATIEWTAGSESAWNLQYRLASGGLWTNATGTIASPFELSGLEQGVSYKVRVQANCGGGDLGDWSDEASFTTNCAAITAIPFTEDFNAALSNCWDITDENTEYYAHSVFNGELRLPGGKAASGHLVKLPEITASLANATMTITYKSTTGANTAVPQVGYMDGENFAELAALDKSNSFKTAYVPLATATGRLALRYDDGTSEGDFDIDEIRISHVEIFEDEEGLNNESRLAALNNQIVDFVMARPILCNGDYNTICLPFDLSAAQMAEAKCPLNGFEVRKYDHANVDLGAEQVDLFLKTVSGIEAGKAYFIRNTGSAADKTYADFRDVTIKASEVESPTKDAAGIIYKGAFNPFELKGGDPKNLYLSSNSLLYYPNTSFYLKGFRAYVLVADGSSALPAIRRGAKVRISEPYDAPTAVENTNAELNAEKRLENGQVVIIRNGVKYTIQGQKIQ